MGAWEGDVDDDDDYDGNNCNDDSDDNMTRYSDSL